MIPRIAFVSREIYPFGGGGLGAAVSAMAAALSEVADVSILTTDLHEERYRELVSQGDAALPDGVRFIFVREPKPEEIGGYLNHFHLWSARVYEALKRTYPDGGPDLVEFPDYLAEGAVTVQAKATLDPALRHTTITVRAYTSHEMCSVLNGYFPAEIEMRTLYDLERYALKYADHFLWPGGDILNTYRRFFGEKGLAPSRLVRHIVTEERPSSGEMVSSVEETFRFIYVGRLERRKGVENLLRAATSLDRNDWSLTLLGGDTPTGPLGVSMRKQLELMAAADPRIKFHRAVKRDAMFDLIEQHHAAIFPSLWECWPFVALHAFDQNRPVLATPVGGFLEMIDDGVSGWLASGTDAPAIATAIERVLDHRQVVPELVGALEPRKALKRLSDTEGVPEQYLELAAERRSRSRPRRAVDSVRPLVSAVVPYYRMDRYIGETIASLFDQTYAPMEVLVVNDGSFREEDMILAELATSYPIVVLTQENSGLGAARNFGIRQSRGRYIFPFDADNVAISTFVERCVDVLDRRADVAYVTSWSRYVNDDGSPIPPPTEGYQPLSNDVQTLGSVNAAGDAAAVLRRRVFDRGFWYTEDTASSYEDWLLYRRLSRAGLHGHVIPERLIHYRVRETSMLRQTGLRNHGRLVGEMEAYLRGTEIEWTS